MRWARPNCLLGQPSAAGRGISQRFCRLLAVELLNQLQSVVVSEADIGRSRRSDHIERQHRHQRIASSSCSYSTEVRCERRRFGGLSGH